MASSNFYDFLADAALLKLMEHVKSSNDVLDVIRLIENQHSDMLAWCLSPNEGHGQGDAVIKDFLLAAYREGADSTDNAAFFKKWTAGRIQIGHFGSAFLTREFALQALDGKASNRLDLFLIDPANKIVVTIENKFGAKLSSAQLDRYRQQVQEQIAGIEAFDGYAFAFVVLDRDLESYGQDKINEFGNRWALLSYKWLERSADRARLHVDRDNYAAQLLMAYCEKQTGWQSHRHEQISELAADLASRFELLVRQIALASRIKPTQWTPDMLAGEGGELLIFVQQNRQLCDYLVQATGIRQIWTRLESALEDKGVSMEPGRTSFNFSTACMRELGDGGADSYWPIYVHVFRHKEQSGDGESKYWLMLGWNERAVGPAHVEGARLRLHFAEAFEGLGKALRRPERTILIEQELTGTQVLEQAKALERKIAAMVRSAREKNLLDVRLLG